ncbi:hypothetical protein Esti_004684 [Eimeria stiedai]
MWALIDDQRQLSSQWQQRLREGSQRGDRRKEGLECLSFKWSGFSSRSSSSGSSSSSSGSASAAAACWSWGATSTPLFLLLLLFAAAAAARSLPSRRERGALQLRLGIAASCRSSLNSFCRRNHLLPLLQPIRPSPPCRRTRRGNRRSDSQKGGGGPSPSPRSHPLRRPAGASAAALRAPPAVLSRDGRGSLRGPPRAAVPALRGSASSGLLLGASGGGESRASAAASQAAAEIYAFLSSLPLDMSSSTLGPGLVYTKTPGRMFLGTLAHALNEKLLLSLGIEVVVTTAWPYGAWPLRQRQLYEKLGIRHFVHPLLDESSQMIRFEQLPLAAMREALLRGRNVFVHCEKGISRSVAVCMAYLILYEGHTFRSSYYTLRRTRPIARPNLGFIQQLLDFEARVRGRAPQGPSVSPLGRAPVGVTAKLSGVASEARLKPPAASSPFYGERQETGAALARGPPLANGKTNKSRGVSVALPCRESNSFPGAGGRSPDADHSSPSLSEEQPRQQGGPPPLVHSQGSSNSNSSSSSSSTSTTFANRIASDPSRGSSTADRNGGSSVNGISGDASSVSSSSSSNSSSSNNRRTAVLSAAAAAPAFSLENRLCGVSAAEDRLLPVAASLALTAAAAAAAPALWGHQGHIHRTGCCIEATGEPGAICACRFVGAPGAPLKKGYSVTLGARLPPSSRSLCPLQLGGPRPTQKRPFACGGDRERQQQQQGGKQQYLQQQQQP